MIVGALFLFASLDAAETSDPAVQSTFALAKGTNEFSLWAGGSPDSTHFIGKARNRSLFLVGLRYGRILSERTWGSLEYTFDVIPAAVVYQPHGVKGNSRIYGAGLSPLGFKVNFGQYSRIKPFVDGSVGFLYFQRDVPVPDSSRFNFTPQLGFGVQLFLTRKTALSLGYKYHHISSAGIGHRNPGLDSNVFHLDFSFFTP
jgi:hypothetical protein